MTIALAFACIASVHDGDTVRLCSGEKVRLVGIDAPELRGSPRCSARERRKLSGSRNPAWCDFGLGRDSRRALAAFLRTGQVQMDRRGIDAYGRTLARFSVNGRDAGAYLVSIGMARPWR